MYTPPPQALALYVFASILQFVSHLSLARMSREASQRATEFAVVDAINKGNRAGVVGAIPTPAGARRARLRTPQSWCCHVTKNTVPCHRSACTPCRPV